jgi:signal transduction histidine kinase
MNTGDSDLEPVSSLHATRLRISHLKLAASDDLVSALQRAMELSARTLDVARVGVWLLGEGRSTLVSLAMFDSSLPADGAAEEIELPLADWPAYAAAIDSRRIIVANDVRTDPATRELGSYVEPRQITSMMDAPIFLAGEVWGIVCHEHVGPMREWDRREIDFAISVADMISALLEQARRIAAESELRGQETMAAGVRRGEALMRMAAGVGHDFNTVLQTIILLVEAARTEPGAEQRGELFKSVLEECQRGARFARRILDFARDTQAPPSRLELGTIVEGMQPSLEHLLSPAHKLHVRVEPRLTILAERAEIEQVVMNLVVNARDAMPDGGNIHVIAALSQGRPTLTVSDEGEGIPPTHMDRIFDPFFSTKGDNGSGLGLATVRSIVETRGGTVSVESAPGTGTMFHLDWPTASDAAPT